MRTTLVFVLALSCASIARADAVDPPPESCPAGSTGQSSHGGPYCSPAPGCTTDADCESGLQCLEIRQCTRSFDCGGLRPPDAGPCTLTDVEALCDADDASCPTDSTCAAPRRVCVTSSAIGEGGGCGCSTPSSSRGSALGVAAAVAMLGLVLVRKRAS